jgi:rubrerythrin
VYGKIDAENIYHELSDYVFNDPEELKVKFEWIKENYEDHLRIQREVLLRNLSTEAVALFEKESAKIDI